MNSSLLGMWRMQHRMDLALILKALSPSLRPSLTSWTTSSGLTSPLSEETIVKKKTCNEPNLIYPFLTAHCFQKNTVNPKIHITKACSYSNKYLLFLVPWYGVHFSVSQKMWAVSDLNINHSLLGFVLDKLIGYSLYGISVSTEKGKHKMNDNALWL